MDSDSAADCAHVEGGGCLGGASPCVPPDSAGTGEAEEGTGSFQGESVCAPSSSAALLLVFLAGWLRRGWRAGPLLLLLVGPAWAGVDATGVGTGDGGVFCRLPEADLGAPWSPQGALSLDLAEGLVTFVDTARTPLLGSLATVEAGASVRLGELARVGVAVPLHAGGTWDGAPFAPVPGDTSLWVRIPLREAARGPLLAWSVGADLPTGDDTRFLGEPHGRVHGNLASEWPLGPWRLAGALDLGLALPTSLVDFAWGTRLGWGLGVHRALVGPLHATLETTGSVGMPPAGVAGDLPWELDLTVGARVLETARVDVGGGFGLTRGLGSPSSRILLVTTFERPPTHDTDGDGLVDRRDACVLDPEDPDGIVDGDGCPEVDADLDGLLDEVDACPVDAEVVNGLDDGDGCPDEAATLRLLVRSADPARPLEQARVTVGREGRVLLGEEESPFVAAPGDWSVAVEAEGWHPGRARPRVVGETSLVVALEPIEEGTLAVRLQGPGGAPLAGWFRLDDEVPVAVGPEGAAWTIPAGAHRGRGWAEGHDAVTATVELPARGRLDLVLPLTPLAVSVDAGRVRLDRELDFATDSDRVTDPGWLDALARWLLAHPEVRLLRVEGHADEVGPSGYNLDLSRRRAAAVVEGLTRRGVAPERLEGLGSGEARREGPAARTVDLLVLVWEGDGAPTPPR